MTPNNSEQISRKKFIDHLYFSFCKSKDIQYFGNYAQLLVESYDIIKDKIKEQLCDDSHRIDFHKIISGSIFSILAILGIKPKSSSTELIPKLIDNQKAIEENINFALFIGIIIFCKWTNKPVNEVEKILLSDNFRTEHKKWLFRITYKIHKENRPDIDLNDIYALSQIWYLIEKNCQQL